MHDKHSLNDDDEDVNCVDRQMANSFVEFNLLITTEKNIR